MVGRRFEDGASTGGVQLVTVTLTEADVVAAPVLSTAIALNTYVRAVLAVQVEAERTRLSDPIFVAPS